MEDAVQPLIKPQPRVACYSRVSTDLQTTENQVVDLRRYCELRGWQVTHEIKDDGWSSSRDDRPGLRELMGLARERKVDVIVVVALDRLFRSLKHLIQTLDEFEALNVRFVAIRDGQFDLTTPQGRLIVQVIAAMAEFEKSLIRSRTIAALRRLKESGVRLGRPPVTSTTQAAIRRLRAEGNTYAEIQTRLQVGSGTISKALGALTLKNHPD